ncbi:hypothetical protein [Aeromicrobium sp. 179-A 4D2 NHS]|uniref:hypothetical protein n=1 Tax=Aeromicrobium sp. 179-A 4D2 NHS TaxID=3142375 RepID=UPI0039A22D01
MPGTDLQRRLSFPWSTVLDRAEMPKVRFAAGSDLFFFHLDVGGTTYSSAELLAAEVKAWRNVHAQRREPPPSLTRRVWTTCPSCGSTMLEVSDAGAATGYYCCLNWDCCWSEVGFLTKFGQNVLGQSWPGKTVVTSANDGGKVTTVTATTPAGVFVGSGGCFDTAEHHAFLEYLDAVEDTDSAVRIGTGPSTGLMTAC